MGTASSEGPAVAGRAVAAGARTLLGLFDLPEGPGPRPLKPTARPRGIFARPPTHVEATAPSRAPPGGGTVVVR